MHVHLMNIFKNKNAKKVEQIFNYCYHFTLEFGEPLLSEGPGACPIFPVGNQSLSLVLHQTLLQLVQWFSVHVVQIRKITINWIHKHKKIVLTTFVFASGSPRETPESIPPILLNSFLDIFGSLLLFFKGVSIPFIKQGHIIKQNEINFKITLIIIRAQVTLDREKKISKLNCN